MPPEKPSLLFTDHTGTLDEPERSWFETLGALALPLVIEAARDANGLLVLEEVEITFVDDPTIDRIHRQFMDITGATDVITFHHGEILVSLDTAKRQSAEFETVFREEVLLYVIHGLLHLAGYTDKEPAAFEEMKQAQDRILTTCLQSNP